MPDKLVAFYNGINVLVDKRRATDITYPDLCKAVDAATHNTPVSKLDRHGFDRWTMQWIKNWKDGHTQEPDVQLTSGIPQGLAQQPALSHTFISNVDSEIECTMSNSANNIKPYGVFCVLEGRDAIQRDLNRHERWACANLLKFNKTKGKVLQLDRGNPKHKYRLSGVRIESSPCEKDLDVLVG